MNQLASEIIVNLLKRNFAVHDESDLNELYQRLVQMNAAKNSDYCLVSTPKESIHAY